MYSQIMATPSLDLIRPKVLDVMFELSLALILNLQSVSLAFKICLEQFGHFLPLHHCSLRCHYPAQESRLHLLRSVSSCISRLSLSSPLSSASDPVKRGARSRLSSLQKSPVISHLTLWESRLKKPHLLQVCVPCFLSSSFCGFLAFPQVCCRAGLSQGLHTQSSLFLKCSSPRYPQS